MQELKEPIRTISAYVAKNYGPACSHCGTFYAVPGSPLCASCIDTVSEVKERDHA
jgi:hypothetical protein